MKPMGCDEDSIAQSEINERELVELHFGEVLARYGVREQVMKNAVDATDDPPEQRDREHRR